MNFELDNSVNERIDLPEKYGVELFLKREDLIHPFISGNKYRKLKYNLEEALKQGKSRLLTFGGAYSNHIAAVAYAGKKFGLKTIGVIRGEELFDKIEGNSTLSFAKACGMHFKFVSRELFREKESSNFIEKLKKEFEDFYLIPEGGTNDLAIKGCKEILTGKDKEEFNLVCCAVGTGGTISGVINSLENHQKILGFPALKGSFLKEDISKFVTNKNWELINDYHFGGYAKVDESLITFINQFNEEQNIPLDPIYTGKMMFGIFNLLEEGYFQKGTRILAIHTGGLQGVSGMNTYLKKKKMKLIKYK